MPSLNSTAQPSSSRRAHPQVYRMVSLLPGAPAIRASRLTLSLRRATIAILLAPVLLVASVIGAGFYLSAPSPAAVGPPPPDLGAEAVTIASPSSSELKGWYIAGRPGGGVVVLLHGVNANRIAMLRRGAGLYTVSHQHDIYSFMR